VTVLFIIIGASSFVIGAGLAYMVYLKILSKKATEIVREAEEKGETIKKDKLLQAKEKFLALKEEHGKEIKDSTRRIQQAEDRIKSKESQLSKQIETSKRAEKDLEKVRENLTQQLENVEKKQAELEKAHQKTVTKLEEVSGMNQEEARAHLIEELKEDARSRAAGQIQEIIDEAQLKANQEAKKIVIQSIQRVATEHAIENSVSVFNIENGTIYFSFNHFLFGNKFNFFECVCRIKGD
jgi:ribonuclease Y